MLKLLVLKGLPASGKSTYARELVRKGGWRRVNKDDLRAMMDNSKWSKQNERNVVACRDSIITLSLRSGSSVVVDDTNFHASHRNDLKQIAEDCGAVFDETFFDTPVDECIKRDLQRSASVGERVIKRMYNQYLRPVPPKQDESLAPAIICDIDGTLAHGTGRSMYDWKRVGEDELDRTIDDLIYRLCSMAEIIFLSGRDEICRPETEEWLYGRGWDGHKLYMRPEGDNRKDTIVKRELYDKYIRDKYYVKFVLDDRDSVVEMWRSLGLKCLQVAEGDF